MDKGNRWVTEWKKIYSMSKTENGLLFRMQTNKKEDCNPNVKCGQRCELVKAKRKEKEKATQKLSMRKRETQNDWLL